MRLPLPHLAAWLLLMAAAPALAEPAPVVEPQATAATVTYDLTPLSTAAPLLEQAWQAHRGEGDARAVAAELGRALEDEGAFGDSHTRAVARWLHAELLHDTGRVEAAEAEMRALLGAGSTLADPLREVMAAEAESGGRFLAAADLLLDITPGTTRHLPACRKAAALIRRAGASARGARAFERVLTQPLSSWTKLQLTRMTAELWKEAGDLDAAARVLRALWWEADSDDQAERVTAAAAELGIEQPLREQVARMVLRARSSDANAVLKRLAALRPKGSTERRLIAWGRAVLDAADPDTREDAVTRLVALTPKLAGTKAHPWALLGLARGLRGLDRDIEAAEVYEEIARRWPEHVLATEALVEAGGLLELRGLPADAASLYRRAARSKHRGEAQRDALWRLGFGDELRGAHAQAAVNLARLVERYGGDRDGTGVTWAERAGYWQARATEAQGRIEEAVGLYTHLAMHFPLGWYATLAARRRADLLARPDMPLTAFQFVEHPGRLAANDLDGLMPPRPLAELKVVHRPVLDLAVAYVRLGDPQAAAAELESLLNAGQLPGSGRALLASVLRALGDDARAQVVLRRGGVLAETVDADDIETYAAAYPFEHGELIEKLANDNGVPPALLAGLVHVESRYNPKAVSRSGAIGLTQLMPTTARVIAQKLLGKVISTRALRDPETNLSIGAGLLGELLRHFQGNAVLALAGYNAGRGATRSWLEKRSHLATDAFVETIPYDQTRRYVMRVIAVSEVYRRLHHVEGAPVDVPMTLPLSLGPFLGD
ncbi:MAG: lytic transglycosylase domain-containing protein [Deltaproteobacteria bacterium]|nr:lytic transglycosylase domain-containing protein [Deltaproteobacteria bacterium]